MGSQTFWKFLLVKSPLAKLIRSLWASQVTSKSNFTRAEKAEGQIGRRFKGRKDEEDEVEEMRVKKNSAGT